LLPLAVLVLILAVLIWYAVGAGLRPLDAMSRAVGKRRPDAMSPLPERDLPSELKPLAASLNALLVRLDEALAAQRRFTADAAHELRTPLAAIKLQVELAERAPDDAERNAALHELERGVDRASHLVEQLLTMARLEPEAPGRHAERIELAAVVREAIVDRAPLATEKQIDLGLVRESAATVRGDRANVAVLIGNLLDNALRYTPAGGRIDVAVDRGGDGATLTVTDSGPGIPEADRERVFERFYRVRTAGEAEPVGSGLGLSIVRRIATAYGATVQLDDGPGGRGLTVRVTFPPAESP
jgi:two-component system, OmpR family, sensor kinase